MSWAGRLARRVPGVTRLAGGGDVGAAVEHLQSETQRIDATVREAVDDLTTRIAALEQRLAAVERRRDE